MGERLGAALQIAVSQASPLPPGGNCFPVTGHPGAPPEPGPPRPAGLRGDPEAGEPSVPAGSLHSFGPHPGPSPHARGPAPPPRRPRVSPPPRPLHPPGACHPHPVRGWRGGSPPPGPGRRGPAVHPSVPLAAGEGRGAGLARLPSPGTRQPSRAPPATAHNEREGKAAQIPLPESPPQQESPWPPPPRASPTGVMVPGQPREGPMRRRGRHPHTHPPSPPPQLFTSQSLQPTGRRHLGRTAPPPS